MNVYQISYTLYYNENNILRVEKTFKKKISEILAERRFVNYNSTTFIFIHFERNLFTCMVYYDKFVG